MGYRITLQPSGHTFLSEPQESLLEAALRSGLNINYSCSSGNCGNCRARLLSGQFSQRRPSDFHFTEQERQEGFFLLCTSHAGSDMVLEAHEASSTAEIPLQQIKAKVQKIERLGGDFLIILLKTPRSRTLRFLAGQHLALELPGVGRRDLFIASCPCNGMYLELHIKNRDGDPFIDYLFEVLQRGEEIDISGPYGSVTLDDESRRPLIFVALDTKFAPIKSLIEHAINLELPQPIRLFWAMSGNRPPYQENHCRAWNDLLDDYRFTPLAFPASRPGEEEAEESANIITAHAPPLVGCDIYLCGHDSYLAPLRQRLLAAGAYPNHLFTLHRREGQKGKAT